VDRRKFLVSSGLVGVGVPKTGSVAPEILQPARSETEPYSHHTYGGETRGFYSSPFAVPVRRT
jgi:hypothetical protein